MVPDRVQDDIHVPDPHINGVHVPDPQIDGVHIPDPQIDGVPIPDPQIDGVPIPDPHVDGVHIESSAVRPTATWSDWSCTVRLVVADARVLAQAIAMVKNRMAQVERVASRFVVDSDLNWANANSGRPIAVPSLLIELVEAALDGARRSDGALDPTIGRHLAAIGYDRDILLVTDDGDIDDGDIDDGDIDDGDIDDGDIDDGDTAEPGLKHIPAGPAGRTWRNVIVDREMGLLTVPRGTALDLGATAKAQTADWAARAVAQRYGVAVMVEIGGDLAVAGHLIDRNIDPDIDIDGALADWQVDVAERAGATGQRIGVRRGGVATSTTTIRTWHRGGRQMHHIVDPRTGRPSGGPWRTVSVAAESAVEANVCSTAAIVLGERAVPWLQSQAVAARLIDQHGRVTVLGGWPADRTISSASPELSRR